MGWRWDAARHAWVWTDAAGDEWPGVWFDSRPDEVALFSRERKQVP